MAEMFKIEFDIVKRSELARYHDADPTFYTNTRPVVTVDQVAEEHWETVHRIDLEGSIRDQARGLRGMIEGGELIRNVRLFKAVSEPEWEEVR